MSRSPNVLFLFADQHNAGVLGAESHPDVLTPHLDRLAAEGTRFTRAYCQDGVCTPSRCSLFSGLYPRTLGCLGNPDRSQTMNEVFSLPAYFQANGYLTAAFGKRHLYLGCDRGWDIAASHLVKESPADNYVSWVQAQGYGDAFDRDWAAEWGRGAEGTPSQERKMPFELMTVHASGLPEGMTMEAWTKRRTLAFLGARPASIEPWFCFSSFYRPHQPYTPLPAYFARFDRSHWGRGRNVGDGLCRPPSLRQNVSDLPPLLQRQHEGLNRVWRLDLARRDEQLYRDYIAAYYALVEEIDHHVGDILQALDESGQAENTIVVYASDHGDFVGAHGMVEKCAGGHNVYEDTLRVPLIFRLPERIRKGAVCNGLAELVDLYPTLADLCGLAQPDLKHPLQGQSLTGTLLHGEPIVRDYSVSENWSQSTLITNRYKLGQWTQPRNPAWHDFRAFGDMLFDRERDPLEIHNFAGATDYSEVEAVLRTHRQDWETKMAPRTAPYDPSIAAPLGA